MVVVVLRGFAERNVIHGPVLDPGFRGERFRKGFYFRESAAHDNGLGTALFIDMHVHGGNHEMRVRMLMLGHTFGKLPLMMVKGVTHNRHAAPRIVTDFLAREFIAHKVPHGFGAVAVAPFLNEPVKGLGQIIIKRNRDALHTAFLRVFRPPDAL